MPAPPCGRSMGPRPVRNNECLLIRTGRGPMLRPCYGHTTMTRMTFNLDPPPGFRGLDPHRPVKIYTRNLPHWRQAGASYFVTFHLADALPAARKN